MGKRSLTDEDITVTGESIRDIMESLLLWLNVEKFELELILETEWSRGLLARTEEHSFILIEPIVPRRDDKGIWPLLNFYIGPKVDYNANLIAQMCQSSVRNFRNIRIFSQKTSLAKLRIIFQIVKSLPNKEL